MGVVVELRCVRCGTVAAQPVLGSGCAVCDAEGVAANLETVYDPAVARAALLSDMENPDSGLVRYRAVLPVSGAVGELRAAGGTPLWQADSLAAALGVRTLLIKDETRGLTWSFKDRGAAIAAAHATALGARVVVVASTGNAAAATAAWARRFGRDALVLMAQNVDPGMAAFTSAYQPVVVQVASKPRRWELMAEGVRRFGWYPNSNYRIPAIGNNPFVLDGYKTISYEIWEQLGRTLPGDVYFSIGLGDALAAVDQGIRELTAMGLAECGPRLHGGEAFGSMQRTLAANGGDVLAVIDPPSPTRATSAATIQGAVHSLLAVRRTGGTAHTVSDEELISARDLMMRTEGLLIEDTSAMALAALSRNLHTGLQDPEAVIVLVVSSSGLKSLLGGAYTATERVVVDSVEDIVSLLPQSPRLKVMS